MTLHRDCPDNPVKCHKLTAYIRIDRKKWTKIGEYYTLCKEFVLESGEEKKD